MAFRSPAPLRFEEDDSSAKPLRAPIGSGELCILQTKAADRSLDRENLRPDLASQVKIEVQPLQPIAVQTHDFDSPVKVALTGPDGKTGHYAVVLHETARSAAGSATTRRAFEDVWAARDYEPNFGRITRDYETPLRQETAPFGVEQAVEMLQRDLRLAVPTDEEGKAFVRAQCEGLRAHLAGMFKDEQGKGLFVEASRHVRDIVAPAVTAYDRAHLPLQPASVTDPGALVFFGFEKKRKKLTVCGFASADAKSLSEMTGDKNPGLAEKIAKFLAEYLGVEHYDFGVFLNRDLSAEVLSAQLKLLRKAVIVESAKHRLYLTNESTNGGEMDRRLSEVLLEIDGLIASFEGGDKKAVAAARVELYKFLGRVSARGAPQDEEEKPEVGYLLVQKALGVARGGLLMAPDEDVLSYTSEVQLGESYSRQGGPGEADREFQDPHRFYSVVKYHLAIDRSKSSSTEVPEVMQMLLKQSVEAANGGSARVLAVHWEPSSPDEYVVDVLKWADVRTPQDAKNLRISISVPSDPTSLENPKPVEVYALTGEEPQRVSTWQPDRLKPVPQSGAEWPPSSSYFNLRAGLRSMRIAGDPGSAAQLRSMTTPGSTSTSQGERDLVAVPLMGALWKIFDLPAADLKWLSYQIDHTPDFGMISNAAMPYLKDAIRQSGGSITPQLIDRVVDDHLEDLLYQFYGLHLSDFEAKGSPHAALFFKRYFAQGISLATKNLANGTPTSQIMDAEYRVREAEVAGTLFNAITRDPWRAYALMSQYRQMFEAVMDAAQSNGLTAEFGTKGSELALSLFFNPSTPIPNIPGLAVRLNSTIGAALRLAQKLPIADLPGGEMAVSFHLDAMAAYALGVRTQEPDLLISGAMAGVKLSLVPDPVTGRIDSDPVAAALDQLEDALRKSTRDAEAARQAIGLCEEAKLYLNGGPLNGVISRLDGLINDHFGGSRTSDASMEFGQASIRGLNRPYLLSSTDPFFGQPIFGLNSVVDFTAHLKPDGASDVVGKVVCGLPPGALNKLLPLLRKDNELSSSRYAEVFGRTAPYLNQWFPTTDALVKATYQISNQLLIGTLDKFNLNPTNRPVTLQQLLLFADWQPNFAGQQSLRLSASMEGPFGNLSPAFSAEILQRFPNLFDGLESRLFYKTALAGYTTSAGLEVRLHFGSSGPAALAEEKRPLHDPFSPYSGRWIVPPPAERPIQKPSDW